jgi:hypothetical protein
VAGSGLRTTILAEQVFISPWLSPRTPGAWTPGATADLLRNVGFADPIDTEGLRELLGSAQAGQNRLKGISSSVPASGKMGNLDEIAKAVVFLASDDGNFITGIELFVGDANKVNYLMAPAGDPGSGRAC